MEVAGNPTSQTQPWNWWSVSLSNRALTKQSRRLWVLSCHLFHLSEVKESRAFTRQLWVVVRFLFLFFARLSKPHKKKGGHKQVTKWQPFRSGSSFPLMGRKTRQSFGSSISACRSHGQGRWALRLLQWPPDPNASLDARC